MQKLNFKKIMAFFLAIAMLFQPIVVSANTDLTALREQVLTKANKLLASEEVLRKFITTPYIKNEFDETPWYVVWEDAQRYKAKIDALFTENELNQALEVMTYNEMVYDFPISHVLTKDGTYEGDFKIVDLHKIAGKSGFQELYRKGEANADLQKLFAQKLTLVKEGNNLKINLFVDKAKVKTIRNWQMNKIATIEVRPDYIPIEKDSSLNHGVSFVVPGEAGAEQIAVELMAYEDENHMAKKARNFGIEINYASLVKKIDEIEADYYRVDIQAQATALAMSAEKLKATIQQYGEAKVQRIEKAIEELKQLAAQEDITYDKLNNVAFEIDKIVYEVEVMRKVKEQADIQEYSWDLYTGVTGASINNFKQYIKEAKDTLTTKSLKDLVVALVDIKNGSINILRYDVSELESLYKQAETKKAEQYEDESYVEFLKAKLAAKKWLDITKVTKPLSNETKDHVKNLKKAMDALTPKTPQPKPQPEPHPQPQPQPQPQPEKKEYTVSVKFLKADNPRETSKSNLCLLPKARYVVKGEEKTLELNLVPMFNGVTPVGVISDLLVYQGNETIKAEHLQTGNIMMSHEGVGKNYQFPSKVGIRVDGTTTQVKARIAIQSPIIPEHDHDVFLQIDYANKTEGYDGAEENLDKQKLADIIEVLNEAGYRERMKVVSPAMVAELDKLLKEATAVRDSAAVSQPVIDKMYEILLEKKKQIDLVIGLYDSYAQQKADYESDLKSGKFSEESMMQIKRILEEVKAELEKGNITIEKVVELGKKIKDLYLLARYDVSLLEAEIKSMEKTLSNGIQYTEETKKALSAVIAEAKEYVEKAKETRKIADNRKNWLEKLAKASKDLKEMVQEYRVPSKAEGQSAMAKKISKAMNPEVKIVEDSEHHSFNYEISFKEFMIDAAANGAVLVVEEETPELVAEETKPEELLEENLVSKNQITEGELSEEIGLEDAEFVQASSSEMAKVAKVWLVNGGDKKQMVAKEQSGEYPNVFFVEGNTKLNEMDVEVELNVLQGMQAPAKIVASLDWNNSEAVVKVDSNVVTEKEKLQILVEKAKTKPLAGFSEESVKALKKAILDAETLLKNERVSFKQVNDEITNLNKAMNELKAPNENGQNPPSPQNPKDNENGQSGETIVNRTVYVKIENVSEPGKLSMANAIVRNTMDVQEKGNVATYQIYFKQLNRDGLVGNLEKFYVYENGERKEAKQIAAAGEYNAAFEFTRNSLRESKIKVAVTVDIMRQLGNEIQDAMLVLDWSEKNQDNNQGNSQGNHQAAPKNGAPKNNTKKDDKAQMKPKEMPITSYLKGYPDGSFKPFKEINRGEIVALLAAFVKEETMSNQIPKVFSDVKSNAWNAEAIAKLANMGIISGYQDSTFQPSKGISRAEFAAILAKLKKVESKTNAFQDTQNHWAASAINACRENGWIIGYTDGTFRPDQILTRVEAVVIINRVFGIKADESKEKEIINKKEAFVDVKPSDWFYRDIMIAK